MLESIRLGHDVVLRDPGPRAYRNTILQKEGEGLGGTPDSSRGIPGYPVQNHVVLFRLLMQNVEKIHPSFILFLPSSQCQ